MGHPDKSLIIKGGVVIDGTGVKPFPADVFIRKGKIKAIGSNINIPPDAEIYKAENRIVCPGFIDAHAHDDLYLLERPDGEIKIRQGVTTVIGGNCGVSPAPLSKEHKLDAQEQLRLLGGDGLSLERLGFYDYRSYLGALDRVSLGINYAGLVGHGMIRLAVMGMSDHVPSIDQAALMRDMLGRCLDQGAIGLSLGLIYAPGAYATIDELVDLSRVVCSRNAIVSAHIRGEGGGVVKAVEEMIILARQSGAAVHISHHKIADPGNKGKSHQTLLMIDRARKDGLAVTADAYPYRAGSTYLAAVLPSWALAQGMEKLKYLLKDNEYRIELRRSIESDPLDRWQSLLTGRGEYRIVISQSRTRPDYIGQTLAKIAEAESRSPHDLVFDLVEAEGLGVGMIIHSMAENDVQRILRHPAVMIGSDGIHASGEGKPHPRLTGTFPRILGYYVKKLGLIDLTEAIRRMTSLTADTFGLKGKGSLAPGMDGDLIVFDPEVIGDQSTYERPYLAPKGIDLVIVGGSPALINGRLTGKGKGSTIHGAG